MLTKMRTQLSEAWDAQERNEELVIFVVNKGSEEYEFQARIGLRTRV